MSEFRFEPLQKGVDICVSQEHKFGTDAFLLTGFAAPRRKDKVCDLGTGCGIIPLLMQIKYDPKIIYGVDIQKQAIDQFKATIEKNHLERLVPVEADLRELWEDCPKGSFDLVTCNPPYKAAKAGIESMGEAQKIARHEILCNINDVCKAASKLLKFGGRLCLCNRPERLADVICAMRANKIEPKSLRFVCKTVNDPSWLFLIEGTLGGKPFMKALPPLVVKDGDGYSKELMEIYGGDKNGY